MSRYKGGVISKTPPTISPAVDDEGGTASGIWTMQEVIAEEAGDGWVRPLIPRELWVWGINTTGQLGLGDTTNRSSPVQVGSLINWKQATGGNRMIAAVTTSGKLYTWGGAYDGRLGDGQSDDNTSSPNQVGSLTDWSNVTCGAEGTCAAVKTDGTLWTWGKGSSGRLGNGTTTSISSPAQVGSLTDWLRVIGGNYHTLAKKTDGTAWGWGNATAGQLGDGQKSSNMSSPVQAGALSTWDTLKAAQSWSAGVTTGGKLYTWGGADYGKLGHNNTTELSDPTQVGSLTTWADVACARGTLLAVKTDGTLWSTGYASDGCLGNGTTSPNLSSPVQVGSLTDWAMVFGGNHNVTAIKTDGTLWAWGFGTYGALGNEATSQVNSPIQIGSLTTWLKIPWVSWRNEGFSAMMKEPV